MLVHELFTNALKYGALSNERGTVSVSWSVDREGSLMFVWLEQDGPPVVEPTQKSTGSSVMAGAVRQLGGEIFREWLPTGLRCTLLCSIAAL